MLQQQATILQAFSNAIFRIYGALRGPSTSAELLVVNDNSIVSFPSIGYHRLLLSSSLMPMTAALATYRSPSNYRSDDTSMLLRKREGNPSNLVQFRPQQLIMRIYE